MAKARSNDSHAQYKTHLNAKDYDAKIEEEGTALHPKAKYPHYLPTWSVEDKLPPLEEFEYHEHGKDADPKLPDLLGKGVTKTDLTPLMGSDVSGVQLSSLTAAGREQLALFVAQRKVVVFRDQDFADLPIPEALNFCQYFGRLNVHPTGGTPKGHPEIHLAHRGAGDKTIDKIFSARTNSITWHSDVSYERQPAGTTLMYILDSPDSGGDTIFSDNVEAYRRLSKLFRQRLHGLKALHTDAKMAESSRQRGGIVRKEPVKNTHPIVRTHPATGEKALFVNPYYVENLVGFKQEESDALLNYLYSHIANSLDLHVRVKWTEKAVVVWDNRVTNHAAIFDWVNGQRRHLARITPEAEKPYETPFEGGDD